MKKFYLGLVIFLLVAVWIGFGSGILTETVGRVRAAPFVSPNLVISQFQTRGAAQEDEFVELHNTSLSPVDLNGFRVVYRSANGTNDVAVPFGTWTTSTIIPPGGYYLIAASAYDGPATPDLTYTPSVCQCSMSANGGGLAVRNASGIILDSVGWGTANNAFIETLVTAAPPLETGQTRLDNACQDTDNNANDFANSNPAAPRNSSSPVNMCGGGGGSSLLADLTANPRAVSPGASVLFAMTVLPAADPPSTGITVNGNLSNIGGPLNQQFFDDGTNGDALAGDNVFSYLAAVPDGSFGGIFNISATAADLQERSVSRTVIVTINAPLPDDDPLLFGNPSNATAQITEENNYLLQKPQYTLSYNRSKATPNWTAWRLDSTWIGSTNRQDDFRPDPSLPAEWYQVLPEDYSEPVYDRGHMCPSGDRTNSIPNNSATFLMTNIIPQHPDNNQGPWEEFETYCRGLASQGSEIYIISGPVGNIGTIGLTALNRVVVPSATWKVVLVLENGPNDLRRVTRITRAFGIIVPNQPPINREAPWRNFRVTVDEVEELTGYNFFSAIPRFTQAQIERRRDRL